MPYDYNGAIVETDAEGYLQDINHWTRDLAVMIAKQDSVVNTYSALVEVDALAKQQYVEVIDDDRLVDGCDDLCGAGAGVVAADLGAVAHRCEDEEGSSPPSNRKR